jgi:peroxiredoxin
MAATESTMLPLGTEAPDFALPDPAGTIVSRDGAAGRRGLLVVFACNHCPYVKHVAEPLGRLARSWDAAGIGVVAINSNDATAYPDDAPARMAEQAPRWGWGFPYLVDADGAVGRAYAAACTPDFFLFGPDRRLVYRGRLDASRPGSDVPVTGADLDAAVQAVVAGRPVDADQWPSIGCSIKWP